MVMGSRLRPRTRRRLVRLLIILTLVLALASMIIWFGRYLYEYDIEYHEPRDLDREREYEKR